MLKAVGGIDLGNARPLTKKELRLDGCFAETVNRDGAIDSSVLPVTSEFSDSAQEERGSQPADLRLMYPDWPGGGGRKQAPWPSGSSADVSAVSVCDPNVPTCDLDVPTCDPDVPVCDADSDPRLMDILAAVPQARERMRSTAEALLDACSEVKAMADEVLRRSGAEPSGCKERALKCQKLEPSDGSVLGQQSLADIEEVVVDSKASSARWSSVVTG